MIDATQVDYDYLKPIREAATRLAGEIDAFRAVEIKHALIDYAGAILDAVRVEQASAIREANLKAFQEFAAKPLGR